MKKKYITALLGTVLLSLGIFFGGCGSDNTSQNADSGTNTSSQESNATTQTRTITVSTSANPLPWTYVDDSGNLTGYNIELVKEVFKNYLPQYNLEFDITELASCLTGLTTDRYQIAVNNLGYNEERGSLYLYVGPLNDTGKIVVLRNGITGINSLLDLSGYVTEGNPVVQSTGLIEAYYANHPEVDFRINYTENDVAQQFQELYDGTLDYLWMDVVSYNSYSEEFGYTFDYYTLSDEEYREYKQDIPLPDVYFCLGPDETELADELKEALVKYKESGKWAELSIEWLGSDISPSVDEIGAWDFVVRN